MGTRSKGGRKWGNPGTEPKIDYRLKDLILPRRKAQKRKYRKVNRRTVCKKND